MTLLEEDPTSDSLPPAGTTFPLPPMGTGFPPPPPPPAAPAAAAPARRGAGTIISAVVLSAVVSAGVSYGTVKLTENGNGSVSIVSTSSGSGAAIDDTSDLHALLAATQPAVTAIELGERSNGTVNSVAAGSGVIISADGLMLTNAHVVDATDSLGNAITNPVITVKMFDGTVRSAKVLGRSVDYDIALLRLDDTSNLHPLALADASKFRVGDRVVAIGNALDLGDAPTVSTGIISALDRTLQVSDTVTLHGLIQTDAAINHGNSGGALVDSAGRLIGINSAGIPNAQNVGFAISVGTIAPILADLTAGRPVTVAPIGYIGVSLGQTPDGITVQQVSPGTPAEDAGIREGDIIKSVDGTPTSTTDQLSTVLRALKPGTKVKIVVVRNGSDLTIDLTLATRPSN